MSYAQVVELVDTPVLEAGTVRCEGSSPFLGTIYFNNNLRISSSVSNSLGRLLKNKLTSSHLKHP